MKNIMIIILMVMMTSICLFAGSIKVLTPKNGEKLVIGRNYIIKWNGVGLTNRVKLTLWKKNVFKGVIIKNESQSGSYNWKAGSYIVGKVIAGRGYIVKIREQGGKNFKTQSNSGLFDLVSAKSNIKPAINVLTPVSGGSFYRYENINIRWEYIGFYPNSSANLYLMKNGKVVANITITSSRSQILRLTKYHPYLGTGFKIKVETADPNNKNKKIVGYSKGTFTILKKDTSDDKVKVLDQSSIINNSVKIIDSKYQLNQPVMKFAKPEIKINFAKPLSLGTVKNNKIIIVKGTQLGISLNIKNCIKAQCFEEEVSRPKIYKVNIINNQYNNIIQLPVYSGIIRIEAYNSAGWTVKKILCKVVPKDYFSYSDLEIEKIDISPKEPIFAKRMVIKVTIRNKENDIPRGVYIELRSPWSTKEYFRGIKRNERVSFNFYSQWRFKPGKHSVEFILDPQSFTKDRNKNNNVKTLNFTVRKK